MNPRVDTTFALTDGRRLGYAEWGTESGRPVFQFHGSPAGRLDRWGGDEALRGEVRLITVDRPGIGRSDHQPGRRVADWAADIDQLARHLELSRFSILGLSSGAPYAAACAAKLGDQVAAIALVSPLGRIDERGFDAMGVARFHRLAQRRPLVMRGIYTSLAVMYRLSPDRAHEAFWKGAAPVDREVVDRPEVRERYWPALKQALEGQGRGIVEDMRVVQRPWGFAAEDIDQEVHLFHGNADRIVPEADARYWAEALPNVVPHWCEDEGHFLVEDHFEEILAAVSPAA